MKNRRVLYAGDSPAGGPANYLLSILKSLNLDVTHIPPGVKISKTVLAKPYDLYIFSDYSHADLTTVAENKIYQFIDQGRSSFLMIGGWGSFNGNFGGWYGSKLSQLLPVSLLKTDDRLNYASGLYLSPLKKHSVVSGLDWVPSPVICGLNQVKAKKRASVLVEAVALKHTKNKIYLSSQRFPFLVVDETGSSKRAALTCDLAPHWAGGWVDWGKKRCLMPVNHSIKVEIGDQYILFAQNLLNWLLKG